ncbi:hypothetical protein Srot_0347 [Segniliparus rotundus DSM 44985]|uniref:Uncharacterized protein n=1 Tax=Segniliparus rotundus (strain ATCC BAA-972 / CDC 1076 / CIP 108378 / DSM 44985 / JCM 13578) TaxID=640132 RepID=D6ZB75_SEGRD|nr:hypothetical protein [Segniliparus rotundus]ADG96834.1 hypothetical protein Srot_0347 [Segniliparus rotundus DSM 44985]
MTTAAKTGHDLIQDGALALGFQAIDQVVAAADALRSIGVQCQAHASGTDLRRRYEQWGPLGVQKIARAAELLDNARTGLEELRADAGSAADRLAGAWADTAGRAACENYQAASARADADLAKVGQSSRALGVYHGALVQLLDSLRTQAQLILDNLLASLGQYRTTDAVLQAVRQVQDVMGQRPAAPNARDVVDAMRQQLQNQVATPTEYAAAQLRRLLDMAQQQGAAATELVASALRGVNTDPYLAPEFPVADEPDCGCLGDHDEKKPEPPATVAAAQSLPAAGGWSGGGPSGSPGASGGAQGSGGADAPGSSGPSGKGVGPDDSVEGDEAAHAAGPAGDDTASEESASAPDLGFLGDIGSAVGSAIGSIADAAGQIVTGLAGALGSGVGAVGTALSGTDFSKLDGDDAKNATEASADESVAADEAEDDVDAESFDVDPDAQGASGSGLDAEADLDSAEEAGDDAASLSAHSPTATPENDAAFAQPAGDACPAAAARQHAEPMSAAGPAQVGHGEFEIAANQLQAPAPKEDAAERRADAVPATTPVSAQPSTIPSF